MDVSVSAPASDSKVSNPREASVITAASRSLVAESSVLGFAPYEVHLDFESSGTSGVNEACHVEDIVSLEVDSGDITCVALILSRIRAVHAIAEFNEQAVNLNTVATELCMMNGHGC